MDRLKVVWICHVSNREIEGLLKPAVRTAEMAPWITLLAGMFEAQPDIELHVVAPHAHIGAPRQFQLRGVNYHFIDSALPFAGLRFPGLGRCLVLYNEIAGFRSLRRAIRRTVAAIQPDIVHLHGAENAYYSSSILDLLAEYPVLVSIQGFIGHARERGLGVRQRIRYERRIVGTCRHFGYRSRTMAQDIRNINPHAVLHWHYYPYKVSTPPPAAKRFDVVYFARVSKEKGIEDLLEALSRAQATKPDITACILGGGGSRYVDRLKLRYSHLHASVEWRGFLPTQEEVHQAAVAGRICVLPTHFDTIPGTIIESMFLRLPVVAYNVGSIHEINEREEIVTLVEKDDIDGLTAAILGLLRDTGKQQAVAARGHARAVEMFDSSHIVADLRRAYAEVMASFRARPPARG
jgi:glycosyltransferase involved in cell wall biosynthesis